MKVSDNQSIFLQTSEKLHQMQDLIANSTEGVPYGGISCPWTFIGLNIIGLLKSYLAILP